MAKSDRIVMRLIEIARKERRILTSGRLEDLADLERTKMDLIARLQKSDRVGKSAGLRKLRMISAENQQLYSAAIDGVRRVSDQVAAFLSGPEFKTYGSNGGRQKMTGQSSRLQKRA